MNDIVPTSPVDNAIKKAFGHLRDVSLRDGVQSWDSNLWPIDEILPVAAELNKLIKMGKERGINMPAAELWGGGQVEQPALYLGEDPLKNLSAIQAVMPDGEIQLLYRGRQGFGFSPLSAEVQEKAIETAADKGAKVFRIFDMMNDIENVKAGMAAMQGYKQKHGQDSITIEGAISYISPPDRGERAMTIPEYVDYAVQLAKLGADEIAIKNYAGVGDKEMPELVSALRKGLSDAGYQNMKVNVHNHGTKAELVPDLIRAGADKVDTAIGALSDGPSHANMRAAIYALLADQGIDTSQRTTQAAINNHPMMKQLAHIENMIETAVNKERTSQQGQATTFKKERAILESITQEDMDKYRVAGGALSYLNYKINGIYAAKSAKGDSAPEGYPSKEEFFKKTLAASQKLWEKAGQFNTVTPGAKILIDQALAIAELEVRGKPVTLKAYTDEYIDIAAGRYGKNRGMEKGLGDTQWLDDVMTYRALKKLNKAIADGKLTEPQLQLLAFDANLGGNQGQQRPIMTTDAAGHKQFDLADPALESKLSMTAVRGSRGNLAVAVEKSALDEATKHSILAELATGRSPDPTAGTEAGHAKIAELKDRGHDIEALNASGHRISTAEDAALLSQVLSPKAFSTMLSTVERTGPVQEAAAEGISHLAVQQRRAASGDKGAGATIH